MEPKLALLFIAKHVNPNSYFKTSVKRWIEDRFKFYQSKLHTTPFLRTDCKVYEFPWAAAKWAGVLPDQENNLHFISELQFFLKSWRRDKIQSWLVIIPNTSVNDKAIGRWKLNFWNTWMTNSRWTTESKAKSISLPLLSFACMSAPFAASAWNIKTLCVYMSDTLWKINKIRIKNPCRLITKLPSTDWQVTQKRKPG